MMSYEEYKEKVYKIFKDKFLEELSDEEKEKYLTENEDLIKNSYKSNIYMLENMNIDYFDDEGIESTICDNLSELY